MVGADREIGQKSRNVRGVGMKMLPRSTVKPLLEKCALCFMLIGEELSNFSLSSENYKGDCDN